VVEFHCRAKLTLSTEPLENITYHPPPEYPRNLELLNHFRAVTCYTIHGDPVKQKVWQINVPRIASSFNFVGHGILAFSALHLAYLDPRPRMKDLYASRALRHHQISLCTAIKNLSHVTEENCSALYSFSILVTLYTIASPRKTEDFLLIGEGEIAPWLAMFRGTHAIMETSKAALMSGPLRSMFTNSQRRMELRESCTNTNSIGVKRLEELQHLIDGTVKDSKELSVYVEAIEELRKSYTAFFLDPENSGPTDAFTWVHRVSKEYLFQLKEQTQEALCIFAFFCVLLHQRNSLWWYEGWSTHLMRQIGLLLNEEHRWWIRWPVEQVGLVGCLGLETRSLEKPSAFSTVKFRKCLRS